MSPEKPDDTSKIPTIKREAVEMPASLRPSDTESTVIGDGATPVPEDLTLVVEAISVVPPPLTAETDAENPKLEIRRLENTRDALVEHLPALVVELASSIRGSVKRPMNEILIEKQGVSAKISEIDTRLAKLRNPKS